MTIEDAYDLVIRLGAIAGALAAIGVLARYVVVKPLKRWIAEQIREPLASVQVEVRPNSGHSIKDTVGRIEEKVDTLDERLDTHIRQHGGET